MDSKLIPANQASSSFSELIQDYIHTETEKVLIVEDNPVALEILEKCLKDNGYSIETASKGTDFFEKISHDFSIIILDLNLPDIDGYCCLDFIKKYFKEIPVLVLSSSGTKDAVLSIQHGAANYIQKPVDSDELIKIVQSHIISQRSQAIQKKQSLPKDIFNKRSESYDALIKEIETQPLSDHILFTGGEGKGSLAKSLASQPYSGDNRYILVDCEKFNDETLELILKCKNKITFILKNIEDLDENQVSFLIDQLASNPHKLFLISQQSLKTLKQLTCSRLFDIYDFQHFHLPGFDESREITSSGKYANIIGLSLSEIEKIAILETIEACDGNKSKAARILQVTEKTIYNKLSKYD